MAVGRDRQGGEPRGVSSPLRIMVLGLSLSSSWGNGHATTYRALLRALAARGHHILFLERDVPWYARERDMPEPDFCELRFYGSLPELAGWSGRIRAADVVIVGSFVPEGAAVIELARREARGAVAFYDIDTPVTLAKLAVRDCDYLRGEQIALLDLYLSFTGGPALERLRGAYGARSVQALYCSVDPELYRRTEHARRWDLGYIGTYSPDRQPALQRLLIEPARLSPERRFVVAGPQYPDDIGWPANVERLEHVSPADHAEFYSCLGWTLNVTRADMIAAGYSPSVRLFEAAACGAPIVSDRWDGLDSVLRIGPEIVVADTAEQVVAALAMPEARRGAVADAARRRVLREHTAAHRARELEAGLLAAVRARRGALV